MASLLSRETLSYIPLLISFTYFFFEDIVIQISTISNKNRIYLSQDQLQSIKLALLILGFLLVLKYVLIHFQNSTIINKYFLKVNINNEDYYLDCGYYIFPISTHPKRENFETIGMLNNGELAQSEYSIQMQERIDHVLNIVKENPEVEIFLCKFRGEMKNIHSFGIFFYHLREVGHHRDGPYTLNNSYSTLTRLQSLHPGFRRIELNNLDFSFVDNAFYTDEKHNNITIDPYFLQNLKQFELATNELGIFNEIIADFHSNRSLVSRYTLEGSLTIGMSDQNLPVNIDQPRSVLFLGMVNNMSTIQSNLDLNNSLIATDNPKVIDQIFQEHLDEASGQITDDLLIYDARNVFCNILKLFEDQPIIVRQIFSSWENILPENHKNEYRSSKVTPKLIGLLEMRRVFSMSDNEIRPLEGLSELLQKDVYRESELTQADISSKFSKIFSSDFFNEPSDIIISGGAKRSLFSLIDALQKDQRNILLDLSKLKRREKSAISILLLLLNYFKQLPGWLILSLEDSDFVNNALSTLSKSISFTNLFLHIEVLGNISSWIKDFGLYMSDQFTQHEKLRNYLFPHLPDTSRGVFVNHENRQFGTVTNFNLPRNTPSFWQKLVRLLHRGGQVN